MLISPNPSNGLVQLDLTEAVSNAAITVTDMLGRELLRERMNGTRHMLDLDPLPTGSYIVGLSSAKGNWRERIVLN